MIKNQKLISATIVILAVAVVVVSGVAVEEQLPAAKHFGQQLPSDRKALYDTLIVEAYRRGMNATANEAEIAECFEFLLTWMPAIDMGQPISLFIDTVHYALEARRVFPWGRRVPWSLFLNDVLPYSVFSEPRDPWRPLFYNYFLGNITNFTKHNGSMVDAAQWMNHWGWHYDNPPIFFAEDTNPVGINAYSPFEVIRRGNSSCTGLSEFLVAGLRSIGMPARITGTPHWDLGNATCPHGDQSAACGNHDWIEVWADGGWAFIDEVGEPMLNTSWFYPAWTKHQTPGTINHTIFASSWAPSEHIVATYGGDYDPLATARSYFPMAWAWTDKISSAWDVTNRYLHASMHLAATPRK